MTTTIRTKQPFQSVSWRLDLFDALSNSLPQGHHIHRLDDQPRRGANEERLHPWDGWSHGLTSEGVQPNAAVDISRERNPSQVFHLRNSTPTLSGERPFPKSALELHSSLLTTTVRLPLLPVLRRYRTLLWRCGHTRKNLRTTTWHCTTCSSSGKPSRPIQSSTTCTRKW